MSGDEIRPLTCEVAFNIIEQCLVCYQTGPPQRGISNRCVRPLPARCPSYQGMAIMQKKALYNLQLGECTRVS